MRGLYIHIPFCRQACRYCDFFFTVSLRFEDELVRRIVQEIQMQSKDFSSDPLESLYLGGGTPSLISAKNLDKILDTVYDAFSFREDAEITIECNPDDLNPTFLRYLKSRGFNRLSIGVQSFHERDLELMRRSHTAIQSEQSVISAAKSGFENITIDLIYGIPGQSIGEWVENLHRAISLPISHLSAYHLTFEPGTVFDHWRTKGRLIPVHEDESAHLFHLLREEMRLAGYDHYEISNFALPGRMSNHNLLYWSGLPYLGVGPSAHSFDGSHRRWNLSSLKGYMEGISGGMGVSESESLSRVEQFHDYLITSLRTKWGADPKFMEDNFGKKFRRHFERNSVPFLETGTMWLREDKTAIHPAHWLITDHILKKLFLD